VARRAGSRRSHQPMTGNFMEWWKSTVRNHRPIFWSSRRRRTPGRLQRAFFVAAYFPGSCRACHYMDPYVDQWKASAHANVSCIKCHHSRPSHHVTTLKYWTGSTTAPPRRREGRGVPRERLPRRRSRRGRRRWEHHLRPPGPHDEAEARREAALHELPLRDRPGSTSSRGRTPRSTPASASCATSRGSARAGPGRLPGMPRDATKVVEHSGFMFSHESY